MSLCTEIDHLSRAGARAFDSWYLQNPEGRRTDWWWWGVRLIVQVCLSQWYQVVIVSVRLSVCCLLELYVLATSKVIPS